MASQCISSTPTGLTASSLNTTTANAAEATTGYTIKVGIYLAFHDKALQNFWLIVDRGVWEYLDSRTWAIKGGWSEYCKRRCYTEGCAPSAETEGREWECKCLNCGMRPVSIFPSVWLLIAHICKRPAACDWDPCAISFLSSVLDTLYTETTNSLVTQTKRPLHPCDDNAIDESSPKSSNSSSSGKYNESYPTWDGAYR